MQRRPLLLLAAVHFLLLVGAEHPLADFYDTVRVVRGRPAEPPPTDDVAAAFADFCRVHRAELERLDRHPLDPDQRGRALLRPPARPLPCRGLYELAANRSPCSTSGPRPGSTCSSTTTPTPTGRPREAPSARAGARGRGRRPRVRRAGRSDALCPTSACPTWPSGSGSTCSPVDPLLRRRGPLAAGLPVARQPRRASHGSAPRLANVRATAHPPAPRAGRHADGPAPRGRHHAG